MLHSATDVRLSSPRVCVCACARRGVSSIPPSICHYTCSMCLCRGAHWQQGVWEKMSRGPCESYNAPRCQLWRSSDLFYSISKSTVAVPMSPVQRTSPSPLEMLKRPPCSINISYVVSKAHPVAFAGPGTASRGLPAGWGYSLPQGKGKWGALALSSCAFSHSLSALPPGTLISPCILPLLCKRSAAFSSISSGGAVALLLLSLHAAATSSYASSGRGRGRDQWPAAKGDPSSARHNAVHCQREQGLPHDGWRCPLACLPLLIERGVRRRFRERLFKNQEPKRRRFISRAQVPGEHGPWINFPFSTTECGNVSFISALLYVTGPGAISQCGRAPRPLPNSSRWFILARERGLIKPA